MGCGTSNASQAAETTHSADTGKIGSPPSAQVQAEVEALLRADELRAEAAAAEPLPAGSTWHCEAGDKNDEDGYTGGKELELLFAHTTVIRASWLLAFAEGKAMPERKGVLPAWQDVPKEAVATLHELRFSTMYGLLPLAVLSYGWACKRHPDPTGHLLARLTPVLRLMVDSCIRGIDPVRNSERKPREWGIVMDFMSLPQRGYTTGYDPERDDRTAYQISRFRLGLAHINVCCVACALSPAYRYPPLLFLFSQPLPSPQARHFVSPTAGLV